MCILLSGPITETHDTHKIKKHIFSTAGIVQKFELFMTCLDRGSSATPVFSIICVHIEGGVVGYDWNRITTFSLLMRM